MEHTHRYLGMSYEQASREGARLIEEASRTGHWFPLVERLDALRAIMQRHVARDPVGAE